MAEEKEKEALSHGVNHHKVHPDDVELCETRDIGTRDMLRCLHIGNRKVSETCAGLSCIFFLLLTNSYYISFYRCHGSAVVYVIGTYDGMDSITKDVSNLFSKELQ